MVTPPRLLGFPLSVPSLGRRRLTLGVRIAVTDPAGGVLLVRHSYTPGWHLPGGGVEHGESLAAAAARELQEETGLVLLRPARLLGVCARMTGRVSDHVAMLAADAEAWSGTLRVGGLEIVEAGFFPVARPPDGVTPGTGRRLAELAAGQPPAELW